MSTLEYEMESLRHSTRLKLAGCTIQCYHYYLRTIVDAAINANTTKRDRSRHACCPGGWRLSSGVYRTCSAALISRQRNTIKLSQTSKALCLSLLSWSKCWKHHFDGQPHVPPTPTEALIGTGLSPQPPPLPRLVFFMHFRRVPICVPRSGRSCSISVILTTADNVNTTAVRRS